MNVVYTNTFIRSVAGLKTNLIIVAPMKVGSTWLSELLVQSTGWPEGFLAPAYCQREQEIDLRYMATKNATNNKFFTHLHLKYSDYSRDVFLDTNSKVVLMSRRIDDTLVSLIDHIANLSVKMSPCYVSQKQNIQHWSFEERADYVCEFVLPWYFTFYSGWFDNFSSLGNNITLVQYEDMLRNPEAVIDSIHSYFKIPMVTTSKNAIDIVKGKNTLKNKAISGRGKSLSPNVISRIEKLSSFYKDIDFSPIGITDGKISEHL